MVLKEVQWNFRECRVCVHYTLYTNCMEEVMFELGLMVMTWIGEGQKDILVRKNVSQGLRRGTRHDIWGIQV